MKEMLSIFRKQFPCIITEAATPQEVIPIIKQKFVDMVILDYPLQQVDEYNLVRSIHETNKQVHLLLLTCPAGSFWHKLIPNTGKKIHFIEHFTLSAIQSTIKNVV